jgi:hypothetical protein
MTLETGQAIWAEFVVKGAEEGSFNVSLVPEEGFFCLDKMFRAIAWSNDVMINSQHKTYFTVTSMEGLPSMDVFVKMVASTPDEGLMKKVASFLISIHLRLNASIDKRETWANFCTWIMDLLVANNEQEADEATKIQTTNRLLFVLATFLTEINKPQTSYSYSSSSGSRGGSSSTSRPYQSPSASTEQKVTVYIRDPSM